MPLHAFICNTRYHHFATAIIQGFQKLHLLGAIKNPSAAGILEDTVQNYSYLYLHSDISTRLHTSAVKFSTLLSLQNCCQFVQQFLLL